MMIILKVTVLHIIGMQLLTFKFNKTKVMNEKIKIRKVFQRDDQLLVKLINNLIMVRIFRQSL